MCAADKVWIPELILIHKNIRSVRNSHAQKLTDKTNIASFEDLDILAIMSVLTFKTDIYIKLSPF